MYDFTTYAVGVHGSKTWRFHEGAETADRKDDGTRMEATAFAGLQLEGMDGEFKAVRIIDEDNAEDIVNSPYAENSQWGGCYGGDRKSLHPARDCGGAFRFGVLELHASAVLASQPGLTFGLGLWF